MHGTEHSWVEKERRRIHVCHMRRRTQMILSTVPSIVGWRRRGGGYMYVI
jgi:hypothetical protein